jgi:hypothetical protein
MTVDDIPILAHWCILLSSNCSLKTALVKPSTRRHYWPSVETALPHPPQLLEPRYSYALPKVRWNAYWKTPVPYMARIPWWRILIDKISYRARVHRRQLNKVSTDICYVCCRQIEDGFHFEIACLY